MDTNKSISSVVKFHVETSYYGVSTNGNGVSTNGNGVSTPGTASLKTTMVSYKWDPQPKRTK